MFDPSTARRSGLVVLVVVLGLSLFVPAPDAHAQTRFAVEAGAMVPYSDYGDGVDPSAWIGARAEFQSVNAIGQIAALSFVVQAGYADLELAGDVEGSGSLWALGGGVRVYSGALPFFLSGTLEYMSSSIDLDQAGDDPSADSFGAAIGAGFRFDLQAAFVELEARLHAGFGADDDAGEVDPRFTTFTVGLGLPF